MYRLLCPFLYHFKRYVNDIRVKSIRYPLTGDINALYIPYPLLVPRNGAMFL